MQQLNATAACMLGLLSLGRAPWQEGGGNPPDTMTGWQIYEAAADSVSRFWNVTRSQVYRELARLETEGLVQADPMSGPRDSHPYRLTEAGKKVFEQWLLDWVDEEPRDELLHSPLVLTVFFGDSLPKEKLRQTLHEYRMLHQRRLQRLQRMNEAIGDDPSLSAATLRRGVAYHEMMIAWIEGILNDQL